MNEIKLKPCPFCGGEAKIVKYFGKKTIVYVECTNCLAYMGNQRIITSSIRGKEYFEGEEKLINAWNTRKPMDNIVEKLEEKHMDISGNTSLHYLYSEGYIDALDYVSDIVKQEINNGLE